MKYRQPLHKNSEADIGADEEFFDQDPKSIGANRGINTKRLLFDIFGRWYWIALGLILGLLASSYYISKTPKKYSATSTLLIKQQITSVMSRDHVDEIDMRSSEGLNTAAQRILRYELLERVASRDDIKSLTKILPAPVDYRPTWLANWLNSYKPSQQPTKPASQPTLSSAELGAWLASRMKVSIRNGTRLVDITFEHEIPEVAKALADAIAREHLAELVSAVSEGRTSQSDTLVKQSEEVRIKLQAAESALANYNRAIELHKSLESQETIVSQLARRYLPKHPKMIAANGELKEFKTRFLDEFSVAIHSPVDQAYWKTAGAEIEAVKDDVEARLTLARQLLLARIGVLQGESTSQMAVFNSILTRLEESNINRQGDEASVEISSFARIPNMPSSPNRKEILTTCLAGGGFFGLLIAFILVRIDNKYHSVLQIEEDTGLPVLAAISDINLRHLDQAERANTSKLEANKIDPQQELWDPHLIFRSGTSSTNFAEMFRILRASVSLLGDETKRKITLFSSALPGEGKSLVSSNFALAAAAQGRKTLLIDLDLRKPNIHCIFGISRSEQSAGITEYLASQTTFEESIHREVGNANLHIMLCGKRAPNPGELLNVTRLKQLLAEACEKYDTVVIDSAPLLPVPDTRVIASLVDNFCLVARAHYVPKGAVNRTIELLASAGTLPCGLVLNGFKESRRMIGQNYSYGSYRINRYGTPYQYGYGSYGAYGTDKDDSEEKILKRKRKVKSTSKDNHLI
jgi:polysaccharide biosynthesis transport protein